MNRRQRRASWLQSPNKMRLRKRLVRHAPTIGVLECLGEPSAVIVAAFIEAEHLLVNVGFQMECARRDVSAVQRALQARPKVFDVVRMNTAFDVAQGMVDKLVRVVVIGSPIRTQSVGIKNRTRQHVGVNARDERRRFMIRHDHRANTATGFRFANAALNNAEHRRLSRRGAMLGLLKSEVRRIRGALLSADKGFVRFDFAGQRRDGCVFHRQADAMEHKPSRLLRHAERPTEFVRGRAVLRVGEQPKRRKPFGERNRRILKYRSYADRELPFALLAPPFLPARDHLDRGRPAAHPGARNAVRPAHLDGVGVGPIRVRKVGHGFDQSAGRFHAQSYTRAVPTGWHPRCAKYIVREISAFKRPGIESARLRPLRLILTELSENGGCVRTKCACNYRDG